jgi:hypothetical protein
MCDYSLHSVSSRPAKVGDKMLTTQFAGSSSRGFAAVGEHGFKLVIHEVPPKVAVCLLPGTELAFDKEVRYDRAFSLFGKARVHHKVARFRQIDMNDRHIHHDALEFPDGRIVHVTRLARDQTATVLQLPAATPHSAPVETRQVEVASNSHVALNRASLRPGVASLLMPNQSMVMLWHALRSTGIGLSIGLRQSFRRLKAHKQRSGLRAPLPANVDARKIGVSFDKDLLTSTLRKQLPTQTFEGRMRSRPLLGGHQEAGSAKAIREEQRRFA